MPTVLGTTNGVIYSVTMATNGVLSIVTMANDVSPAATTTTTALAYNRSQLSFASSRPSTITKAVTIREEPATVVIEDAKSECSPVLSSAMPLSISVVSGASSVDDSGQSPTQVGDGVPAAASQGKAGN